MSSEVPTINLFDNDSSGSGSFFESFAQAGDHGSTHAHAGDHTHHTTTNTSDSLQPSPSSPLFGQSDPSHSFFDTLSTEPPNHHATSLPTSTTPVHPTTTHPTSTPMPATSTPPRSPLPTHKNSYSHPSPPSTLPPLPTSPPPSILRPPTSPPTRHEMPTQVLTPAGVIDSSDHQEIHGNLFSSSHDDSVDSLLFESLSLGSGASHVQSTPVAPYPATPPHTPYHTPHSALNAPLPASPMYLHHHRTGSENLSASSPSQSPLPRRGSSSDVPGPSALARNSSSNAAPHLNNAPTPLALGSPASHTASPPFSRVSTPPLSASPPISRVNAPPPISSPSPSRPATSSADTTVSSAPNTPLFSNSIAHSSPAPSTHKNETSPLLTHSSHSAADEHEAPIPHFASTDDDQNIFDSFLGGSQHSDDSSFYGSLSQAATHPPSSTHDHAASTSSTPSHPALSSSIPAASSTSLDPPSSQTYDASQYSQYNYDQSYSHTNGTHQDQHSQYGNYNYDYGNYNQSNQYSSHDNTNASHYPSHDSTTNQYTSQDNTHSNQSSQYNYNWQQSYDQSGYDQQHSYPSYPQSSQYSQHYQTPASNQSYDQYPNNQYNQPDSYANGQYANTQYANSQYNDHPVQYNNHYTANSQYPSYSAHQPTAATPATSYSVPSTTIPPSSTNYSNWTPQQTGTADALLFSRPHPIVSFGFCGKLAYFRPSSSFVDTRVVHVESVRTVLQRTPFLEPFTTYPGPLTSSTSKDAVSRWIGDRISQSTDDGSALLWGLLRVMSEHYGNLIKSPDASMNPEAAIQKLLMDANEPLDIPASATPSLASMQEVQQLLLAGDRAEACRVAAATHQWSHALLLAQFCGPEVYASTITNFATTVLPEGSPLRTMYLLYGRQPQEIFRTTGSSSVLLDKWRANLAAILATNPAQGQPNAQAQPDRRVAAELGDRLWGAQARVEAAHCCYLLADLPHGPVDNPNTRIVLLGADHKRKRAASTPTSTQQGGFPSSFIVNTDAIMRSEIYEWSKVLGNSQYVLPGIHPYKLAYATFMADLGFPDVAVQYVQQLTAAVRAHKGGSQLFTPHYLYQLDTFEERLRGTGAAKSLAASGSWLPRMAKGFSRLFGSEARPASPSAQPEISKKGANDTPKKGSSVKPREEVPMAPSGLTKEELEYAESFSTKKKETKEGDKPVEAKAKEGKETKLDDEQAQKGVFSRLAFWKKSGTEAKLGEENAFEYNEQLKMWVEKGKPLPEPERAPPPPPMTSSSYTPDAASPPPFATGGPPPSTPPPGSGLPPGGEANKFTSPVAAAGGRRKPRYFDSLNEQVYSSKAGGVTPTVTPDKGNVKIFTPFTPPSTFVPTTPTTSFSPQPPDETPPSFTPPPHPQY